MRRIFYIRKIFNLKRLIAITLLAIYLFNLAGYSLYFKYFIERSDKQIVQRLDNNQYDDRDLMEIKVPLHLPYMSNWSGYERIDGEIEFDGVHYNYVKRKVSNDTLFLLCLPNKSKTDLYSSLNDYSKQVNDIPSDKQSGTSPIKKGCFFNEYNQQITGYGFVSSVIVHKQTTFRFASRLSDSFIDKNSPPPKAGFIS